MTWRRDGLPLYCDQGSETGCPGSLSYTADEIQREPTDRPQSHKRKRVWELRLARCTCAQSPDPNPVPGCAETLLLWPGAYADTREELVYLSTSEKDGNFLSNTFWEGEVETDTPDLEMRSAT